jgi:transcriptional regulator CtsR
LTFGVKYDYKRMLKRHQGGRVMRLSDLIAEQINRMLDESVDSTAEIQRNDFALRMGCVPSQINYVISSRFIPEQGYIVESRRGGGGYIRITRVQLDKSSAIMHIVNSIGEILSESPCLCKLKIRVEHEYSVL